MILCEAGGTLNPRSLNSLACPPSPALPSTHPSRANSKAVPSETGPQPYPTPRLLSPTSGRLRNVSALCSGNHLRLTSPSRRLVLSTESFRCHVSTWHPPALRSHFLNPKALVYAGTENRGEPGMMVKLNDTSKSSHLLSYYFVPALI